MITTLACLDLLKPQSHTCRFHRVGRPGDANCIELLQEEGDIKVRMPRCCVLPRACNRSSSRASRLGRPLSQAGHFQMQVSLLYGTIPMRLWRMLRCSRNSG